MEENNLAENNSVEGSLVENNLTPNKLEQIIEALLFSSKHALSARQISRTLEAEGTHQVKEAIRSLSLFYEESQRAFFIQEVAEGYLLTTRKEFQSWIQNAKVQKSISLSPTSMETLSIIAYKQPVTRAEIDEIRGVDTSYVVRSMLDKGLLRILGKKDAPGRPMLYGTSKLFLEIFGFKTIKDLPRPEEFDLFDFEEEDGLASEGQIEEGQTIEETSTPEQALLDEPRELSEPEEAIDHIEITAEQIEEPTAAEKTALAEDNQTSPKEQAEENEED